jgi:hypothetical protein
MLKVARVSSYVWLSVALGFTTSLFAARWLFPPTHGEDYGAGLLMVMAAIAACALGAALALVASVAYFTAWRRGAPFLTRDRLLAGGSVLALAAFLWPVSWLFFG